MSKNFTHQTSERGEIPFYKIGTLGKDPDGFIAKVLFEDFKKKFSYPRIGEILISAAGKYYLSWKEDEQENTDYKLDKYLQNSVGKSVCWI